MQNFEIAYANLLKEILVRGERATARNGETKSLFGMSLLIDNIDVHFPVVQGRKMFVKGILGELAAMLRGPKHIDDFKKWGCNYWDTWANEDGSIDVDYGNAWFDFEGVNQIAELKYKLKHNPKDRRMIISGWRPHKLNELSLPCCHYSYQFHVNLETNELNMIWTQRSVDMMIGLPSDIVFAAAWLISLADEFGYKPGSIKMDLGDCHIYQEHYQGAYEYIYRVLERGAYIAEYPTYGYLGKTTFRPEYLVLDGYDTFPAIQLELKA